MHVIRQYEFGGPEVLRHEFGEPLEASPGHARIAVEASGFHLIDTSIRRGEYFGSLSAPTLPMTPGREVAGVVDAVGEGVGPEWIGRRVVVHLGAANGGYGDQAVAPIESLHVIPAGLSAAVAVAAIGTGRTAVGILDQAPVTAEDVVIIPSAAGGLGSALVQAAVNAGAFVVGLAGGAVKVEAVGGLGPAAVIDYREPGWEERLRAALGDHVPTFVYDGVAGDVGRTAYGLLGAGGRLIQFGWSSQDKVAYDDPDRPVQMVLGPQMTARPGGMRSLEAEALGKAAAGAVVPLVGSTFPLSRAADAHRALEARQTYGKVILVPDAIAAS